MSIMIYQCLIRQVYICLTLNIYILSKVLLNALSINILITGQTFGLPQQLATPFERVNANHFYCKINGTRLEQAPIPS